MIIQNAYLPIVEKDAARYKPESSRARVDALTNTPIMNSNALRLYKTAATTLRHTVIHCECDSEQALSGVRLLIDIRYEAQSFSYQAMLRGSKYRHAH